MDAQLPATTSRAERLRALHAALATLRFDLATGPDGLRHLRDRVVEDVENHVARLADLGAPLLVVFGGVTGAGKSTCVNTLARREVVTVGVLRPTTFAPTLVAHPTDLPAFASDRVLPRLPRAPATGTKPVGGEQDAGVLRLVAAETLPQGVGLVDAPDIDSVSTANRDLADALLDAADLWLWFTSAGKYADEESMRYLRLARERRTALAVVLTQVQPAEADEIVEDFRSKLRAQGLPDVPLLVVPFTQVREGRLPDAAVDGLREWVLALADPQRRAAFRRQTLDGAVRALPGEVAPLRAAAEDELRTRHGLAEDVDRAFARARLDLGESLAQGLPVRSEVLERWDDFVGSGRLLRMAEDAGGRARSWLRDLFDPAPGVQEQRLEREVRAEVGDTLTDLVVQVCELAAAEVLESWERVPPARALLARQPELAAPPPDLRQRCEHLVKEWQQAVAELVATQGAERRTTARWASGAVNAAATGGIVLVLAQTGGLTGAEVGIATAASAANQALLARLLGDQNLRWLVSRSREDLEARFTELAAEQARRYHDALDAAAPDLGEVERLRLAIAQLGETEG